ncbi:hypothetical protein EGM51_04080 [Verrucomicrobia bacterium S94]|nr:hypothetical protein EGM51_04080 [Verrucomicrobia bacterium S94]
MKISETYREFADWNKNLTVTESCCSPYLQQWVLDYVIPEHQHEFTVGMLKLIGDEKQKSRLQIGKKVLTEIQSIAGILDSASEYSRKLLGEEVMTEMLERGFLEEEFPFDKLMHHEFIDDFLKVTAHAARNFSSENIPTFNKNTERARAQNFAWEFILLCHGNTVKEPSKTKDGAFEKLLIEIAENALGFDGIDFHRLWCETVDMYRKASEI